MNIALSAVIIFILLLPPVTFYLAFTFGRFPKAIPRLSLLEGLMISAIFSIVLHALGMLIIQREIRFDIIALLLGGDLKTFKSTVSNTSFEKLFVNFTLYNAALIILSVIVARIFRYIVNSTGWHARSELLRLYNEWWYLFHGYKAEDQIGTGEPAIFDIVFVDALVNTNDGAVIYSGYLIDFECDGEVLNRIYLAEASKRSFKKNEQNEKESIFNETGEPIPIDGDLMNIPYSSIININLHFIVFPAELAELEQVPANAESRLAE